MVHRRMSVASLAGVVPLAGRGDSSSEPLVGWGMLVW
jgi:hypothetical protein